VQHEGCTLIEIDIPISKGTQKQLEEKLRRKALIRNAHASTSLAGNKQSLKQVEALYENKIQREKRAGQSCPIKFKPSKFNLTY